LLEILVVIVIVGVIISVATVSISVLGRDREMQEQAERVGAVLQQAKEECELQGFDVGLRIGTNSYDFLRFDARQQLWRPISDDDLMGARSLPPGLRLRLWLEGREVVLAERLDGQGAQLPAEKADDNADRKQDSPGKNKDDKKKELPPQIMVLASGDLNSFDLRFEREGGDGRWHVFSRPDSTVVAEQVNEEI
jgi:general secretion pathway protein H